MRTVGFSGTQFGMSLPQIQNVDYILEDGLTTDFARHGDCIGADADFHQLCKLHGLWVVGHPPLNPSKRAFCNFDAVEEPEEYIDRNHSIVDKSDWMIFTPKEFIEQLRSGTWATIRYCRKLGKIGWIVWPDGTVSGV